MHASFALTRQHGFTLLEMMIASLLGLIVGGAVILYIGLASTQDMRITSDQRGKETLRFSYEYLAEYIRHAGFTGDLSRVAPIYRTPSCNDKPCSQDGDLTRSDRLALRMTAAHGTDCQGRDIAKLTQVVNFFYIERVNDQPSLYCRSYLEGPERWLTLPEPIIDGVSQMQVQYGIGDEQVERFVQISQLSQSTDLTQIKAIRIALLTETLDPEKRDPSTHPLLDHPGFSVPAGRRATVYIGTFPLLNMLE